MTALPEPRSPRPIAVRGAREHNLRGVDLELAPGRWTSVVGPSGSGKTSLVFDVIVREGERRYLGATSPKARQFFGKLGRARVERIEGLPVPMAVGRRSVTTNPRSTVGTQSGALDLLRLVFAREASGEGEGALTRSHFSANTAAGACPACRGLGLEDRVDPELLVADPSRSIRDGALVPTLKNGYTVYSQVTLEVMERICRHHGFDVGTPWRDLTDAQRAVVLFGTDELVVPFGKHSLESRMKWEGITARPREEGHYRGIVPVIEETLKRSRNPGVLRFVRSEPCGECGGTRLGPAGRGARLPSGASLPELAALSAGELARGLDAVAGTPTGDAMAPELTRILARMVRLGLGHLALERASSTLSGGEAQRLRLAAHLVGGLSGALYALDEPTLGLHPESQAGLRDALDELVAEGNTLLVVEHDPDMVGHADRVVAMGPGAGPRGGALVEDRTDAAGALDVSLERPRRPPSGPPVRLTGATLHNLRGATLEVPRGQLHVVLGPSGAGKSSLVFGTLLPALLGERGGPFATLEGVDVGAALAVDARPMGRSSRSTPATWSGLFDHVRKRFAATEGARARGWGPSWFSFNARKGGRCATCQGLGRVRVGLHLFEDALATCPDCRGSRYGAETLGPRLDGASIADVLAMDVERAREAFAGDRALEPTLAALEDLGLGYLPLGAPSTTLSSGEAQRIRLATIIAAPPREPSLLLFDEPDRGLHPADLVRLVGAFDKLLDAGHTVLCVSHHRVLWRAADALTEVRAGVARPVELAEVDRLELPPRAARPAPPAAIELRGARTHTLRDVDVEIPRGRLTAIIGPSGSGKSSLAFDTLAAEAWRRYAECLPFQVRRFMERAPRPDLDLARGLTPVVALPQDGGGAHASSTVASLMGLGPLLRLLWSRAGDGAALSAGDLRGGGGPASCPACGGRGHQRRCSVERLVTDGARSLADGAMAGTKPGAFFTEPDGQHLATLRAATGHDLDGPWDELPEAVRRVALRGAGDEVFEVTWRYQRGERSGEHRFEGTWDGFLALVEREAEKRRNQKAAAAWAAPLEDVDCAACRGTGLREAVRARAVEGLAYGDALAMDARGLRAALAERAGGSAALDALLPELDGRLGDLEALGAGALPVTAPATALTRGELQRVRLAAVLRSGLTAATVVLDEPGAGLDAAGMTALLDRVDALTAEGNTVVVCTHREELASRADHVIAVGPGAGSEGGRVVASGPLASLPAEARAWVERAGVDGVEPIAAREPGARDLAGASLPRAGLVCLAGAGAAHRLRALADAAEAEGVAEVVRPGAVAARTVLGAFDAMGALQSLFAAGSDLPRAAFSFASPRGRCPVCGGSGVERVGLDVAADLELPCEACGGTRYRPEVLAARWEGRSVADVLAEPLSSLPFDQRPLAGARALALAAGLGHLALGRRPSTLSGGERQRLALAAAVHRAEPGALVLLEAPEAGLAAPDVTRLVDLLRRAAERGLLVVAATEHPLLMAAAG